MSKISAIHQYEHVASCEKIAMGDERFSLDRQPDTTLTTSKLNAPEHCVCAMCASQLKGSFLQATRRHLKRAKPNKARAVKTAICQLPSISLPHNGLSALSITHMHVNQTCQRTHNQRNGDEYSKNRGGKAFY